MKLPFRYLFLSLLALLLFCGAARADSCTAAMTDVNFGTVSPVAGGDYYANGTLTVTCTWTQLGALGAVLSPNASICINAGVGGGGTAITARAMAAGSGRLPYNLFRDSSYAATSVWGSGAVAGTQPVVTTIGGLPNLGSLTQTFTIYGRISAADLAGVPTIGGADTPYVADFAGFGTVQYAFYGVLVPTVDCKTGASTSFAFKAKANVTNNCYISASPLAFAADTRVLTSAKRTVGSLSVQCTANNPYQIALNGGIVSGNPAARQMRNATTGEKVTYEISSTLDGPLWGDGTGGTSMTTGTGSGGMQTLRMYGRVPVQRTPSPGSYKDTVTATIYF
ncbi:spore coat protein U-like protein [Pseudoduganella lurida]|uniref:Spore coat protein U-like protein n=1 Tax=Pseudoduganella lurida TaxID=1036180 RepID=A0A562RE00_9BURK|nr:spore coat U domain-containing protein [Pseudoduganella lurida]TWI67299.1 spore coat protein U-like protein [Pseudoduganella lurida]